MNVSSFSPIGKLTVKTLRILYSIALPQKASSYTESARLLTAMHKEEGRDLIWKLADLRWQFYADMLASPADKKPPSDL